MEKHTVRYGYFQKQNMKSSVGRIGRQCGSTGIEGKKIKKELDVNEVSMTEF